MWFVYWDPCGLACYLFGWATLLYCDYVTQLMVLRPWLGGSGVAYWVNAVAFQAMVMLSCWAYVKAATTDPGSVRAGTANRADIYPPLDDEERSFKPKRRYCEKCECIKPPRAHHCSTCQRCINKMDHHCPWVNNCVGSNNMRHFLQFLFWTCAASTHAALLAIVRGVQCWRLRGQCVLPSGMPEIIAMVISTVLAIFFAIFTVAMACDQYEGAVTNTTAIESMKHWTEEQRGIVAGLNDACGEPCGCRWFLPVAMRRGSPSFYQWHPTDDPDAYDPRDPVIRRHFQRVEQLLVKGEKPACPAPDTSDGPPLLPRLRAQALAAAEAAGTAGGKAARGAEPAGSRPAGSTAGSVRGAGAAADGDAAAGKLASTPAHDSLPAADAGGHGGGTSPAAEGEQLEEDAPGEAAGGDGLRKRR